jgi:hypothetical protein
MFKQVRNYFDLRPTSQGPVAFSAKPPIQLGPPLQMKLGLRQLFIRQGPPMIIPEAHKPLWFEKGWRRASGGKEYTGRFSAAGRTWRGLIVEPYPKGYRAYIWHPPTPDIQRNTSHGPCFSPNGETGRYQVLFHSTPSSLDHVITSIEEVLAQALNGRT